MKKLLFVLAFTFIGQQAFSQMQIVSLMNNNFCSTGNDSLTVYTVDDTGNDYHFCIHREVPLGMPDLNLHFNTIISQGYELINTSFNDGFIYSSGHYINPSTTFIFAKPWTSSGLEEVATTLNNFTITPNPANTFVDISLDYSLKGESEVVFISEAGYISHKQSIGNISKNEKYNIDISKIPTGKYLVTIVNGKTYTTPQKLIIL